MSRKIVHVIGTGTIGEPLIGLLCDFKNELYNDDEVTKHLSKKEIDELFDLNKILINIKKIYKRIDL